MKAGGRESVCHCHAPHPGRLLPSLLLLALNLCFGPCTQWPHQLELQAAFAANWLWMCFLGENLGKQVQMSLCL